MASPLRRMLFDDGETPGTAGGPEPCPPRDGEDKLLDTRTALALLAAAFVTRFASTLLVALVAPDGVKYISMARLFWQGRFLEGLGEDFHPLYPAAIALFRPFCGGFESAAFCVSLLFSSLAVLFLFRITRPLFGRGAAVAACAVFAFMPHFVRCGSDTISEGLFHFLVLGAFWAGIKGFREGRWPFAALGGLLAGGAYLTRPEGILALGAFGAFTAFAVAVRLEKASRLKAACLGLLFLCGFLFAASPYLGFIRSETGRWDFSRKKTTANFSKSLEEKINAGEEVKHPHVKLVGFAGAALEFTKLLLSNFYYVPGALVLLGLFHPSRRKKRDWRLEAPLVAGALLWSAACLWLMKTNGYLSYRHTIPAALLTLGYSGRGAVILSGWAGALMARIPGLAARTGGGAGAFGFFLFLLGFAFVAGVPENFRPERTDKLYLKEIARELEAAAGKGLKYTGNMSRVSFYAGGTHVPLPLGAAPGTLLAMAREKGLDMLVFDEETLKEWAPRLSEALSDPSGPPPGFLPVKTWWTGRNSDRPVRAFRLEPGQAQEAPGDGPAQAGPERDGPS